MSEKDNFQLSILFEGIESLVNLAVMETTDTRPSFLCFLPEFQCTPSDILYMNGITESTGIEHMSGKDVSCSLAKKVCPNEIHNFTNRLADVSLEAESCGRNDFAQSKEALAKPAWSMGDVANGALHELNDTTTGTDLFNSENEIAGCNHVLADDSVEELDLLAFKITEFFNAFREGEEHNLWKFTQTFDHLSPESLLVLEGDQHCPKSNSASVDRHIRSDKVITQADADIVDGRISSSAGHSGKWNGFGEANSFSATLSGPLTFSGPMSFSGNSGHGPYSGSVSHRSDSSTASTHSFAFPILPYEWNSSPVKMAQPDRRFLQRPWKRRLRSFFCCADPFK